MLVVRDQKLSLGDFLASTSTRQKCDCHQDRDDITRVETGQATALRRELPDKLSLSQVAAA